MASLRIVEYTDPACPFGYNAGPALRQLAWRLGDEATWDLRMVVLTATVEEAEAKAQWLTPERMAEHEEQMGREHGMPAAARPRPHLGTSIEACRAVVAARVNAPGTERAVARALRRRYFGALEVYDDPATILDAAADAGLDRDAFAAWLEQPEVEAELREDMAAARNPVPAARALDHKLAGPEDERRYTCPSLEITREADGAVFCAPGFWPYSAYDLLISNVVPELPVREPAGHAEEVLRWAAGEPLSTREVAAVRGIDEDAARAELAEVADEEPFTVGSYWTLRAAVPAGA